MSLCLLRHSREYICGGFFGLESMGADDEVSRFLELLLVQDGVVAMLFGDSLLVLGLSQARSVASSTVRA